MSTPQWVPLRPLKGDPGPPGPSIEVLPFSMQGQIRVASGVGRFPIKGGDFMVLSVAAAVEGAPVGGPIVTDVLANGVSLYAGHPDRRPTIPDGATWATVGAHNATVLSDGDTLSVNVDTVGTLMPGRFLVVAVRLQQVVADG